MPSPESNQGERVTSQQFSLEKMRHNIAGRIEAASSNPIAETRLAELEDQLEKFTDKLIDIGHRDDEQIASESAIEIEILRSSAVADNIVEFTEMLEQLSAKYGAQHKWKEKFLAHENAHASVAQAMGHQWVGYATVFIKDEGGNLSSIQPLHFTKPKPEWGPKELISKNIEVTKAPEKYGDRLSPSDEQGLVRDMERLERIKLREEADSKRIAELRRELGIN